VVSSRGIESGGDSITEHRLAIVRSAAALDEIFADLLASRVEAVYVINERFISANRERMIGVVSKHRLPRIWFDAGKCARGIDALKIYRAEYDDKLQALRPRPVHDWTSHAADSFRYLALTLDRRATHSGFYRRIDYPQHGVV
jgi:hypothetical protein